MHENNGAMKKQLVYAEGKLAFTNGKRRRYTRIDGAIGILHPFGQMAGIRPRKIVKSKIAM